MDEIEIKGKLNKQELDALKTFLDTNGIFEKSFKRMSVDISPGYDPKTKTWSSSSVNLRIKRSDGEEKISLKYGDALSDQVEEYDVILTSDQLITVLKLFNRLGFETGQIYFWRSWVYEYKGAEVKVSRYTYDYAMWEIEARSKSEQLAKNQVYAIAQELGLTPLTGEELKKEIDYQTQNIFQDYSLKNVQDLLDKEFTSSH